MTKIALFGLGSMGFGMGQSLLRDGLAVHGFDVNAEAVTKFEAEGGGGGDLARLAGQIDIAVIVVVTAAQTEAVLFGDGGLSEHLAGGAVVVSCATVPPDFAKSMEARLRDQGILYLDAPISGGAGKAATGELTIMASGSDQAFEAAKPALDALAENVFRLGNAAGAGSAMKIVNQLLAGVHLATAAEAMTFAIKQGIAPDTFMEVISQCAGTSWMLENRGPHIVDGDYTPRSAVDIFVKDLGIVSDVARNERFSAPLAAAALQQFLAAAGMGLGREDDSAVAKVYARNAGVDLP